MSSPPSKSEPWSADISASVYTNVCSSCPLEGPRVHFPRQLGISIGRLPSPTPTCSCSSGPSRPCDEPLRRVGHGFSHPDPCGNAICPAVPTRCPASRSHSPALPSRPGALLVDRAGCNLFGFGFTVALCFQPLLDVLVLQFALFTPSILWHRFLPRSVPSLYPSSSPTMHPSRFRIGVMGTTLDASPTGVWTNEE